MTSSQHIVLTVPLKLFGDLRNLNDTDDLSNQKKPFFYIEIINSKRRTTGQAPSIYQFCGELIELDGLDTN